MPDTFSQIPETEEHPRTAVHFGAGNIGRGFIGPVLVKAGFHVVFSDVNETVISQINQEHSYNVHYLEPRRPFHVTHISGVLSTSEELAEGIADNETKLVTTSVGIAVLKHIAGALARGVELRKRLAEKDTQGKDWSLNVIACENGVGASQHLKDEVWSHLKEDKDKEWAEANVGFPNCSVDRIVPPFDPEENEVHNPLDVGVDQFYEWIVDSNALRPSPGHRALPPIPGLVLTSCLPAFAERKLFIFNCGHAITAYLSSILDVPEETIFAAISEATTILPVVKGAMHESAAALVHKYPDTFNIDEMEKYVDKTIHRFRNPNVVDHITRVGRQPLRKLGKNERLLGPAYMAREFGLPITNLAKGIAAAVMYVGDENGGEEEKELLNMVRKEGMENAVEKVTGFKKGGEEWTEVICALKELEGWRGKAAKAARD